jgi:hypothetical protein
MVLGACAFAASPAAARETFHDLSAEDAARSAEGVEKLLEVPFYLKGQKHPAVAQDLGVFKSNRRTNAFNKSDEKACEIAFLSAVIALQKRAQRQGGDAVVDIRSITKHRDLESPTLYRCVAGDVIANVALEGRVVRFAK